MPSIYSFGKTTDMIESLSRAYARVLVDHGIISEDQKEIYSYGLTALIVNLVNYSVFLALGFIFSLAKETVIFFIFYLPLRNIIGGRHAKTPLACLLYGILMWAFVMIAYIFIPYSTQFQLLFTLLLAVCLLNLLHKKELSSKRKSIGTICLILFLIIALRFIYEDNYYSSLISLSFLCNIFMNL